MGRGGNLDWRPSLCRELKEGEPVLISYGKLQNDFLLMVRCWVCHACAAQFIRIAAQLSVAGGCVVCTCVSADALLLGPAQCMQAPCTADTLATIRWFPFQDYGFIVPQNPYDTVQLSFSRGLIEVRGPPWRLRFSGLCVAGWAAEATRLLGTRLLGSWARLIARASSSAHFPPSAIRLVLALQGAKAFAGVGREDAASNEEADAAAGDLPPLPAWQQKELAALQLVGPGANLEVTIRHAGAEGGPFDPRLIAATRVLCAPNAQALGGRSGVAQLGRWDAPLPNAAAESAAARTLAALCAVLLSQFPQTIQDDAQLLAAAQQSGLSFEQQTAISFRMGKKALMVEAMEAAMAHNARLAVAGKAAGGGSKPGQKPKPSTSKGFGK